MQEFSTKKIIKARNVLFKEEIQSFSTKEEPNPEESIFESPDLDNGCSNKTKEKPVEDELGEIEREVPNAQNQSEDEENNDEVESPLARETRNRRPPERYGNPYTFNATQEETLTEPKTYKETVSSPQATHWKQAMQSEFEALENNDTWTLVDKPKDENVLPGKWVYKVKYSADGQVDKYSADGQVDKYSADGQVDKYSADGQVDKYKAVAKGFAQIEDLDFFETYAPTCKPETFRILLGVAAQKDLHLYYIHFEINGISRNLIG